MATRTEIAAIKAVIEFRSERGAMPRGETYYAGHCVRTVKNTVGAAQDFNLLNAGGRQSTEVDHAANVIQGHAVEQNFIGVAVATAQKERCSSAALSGLHHLCSGDLLKWLKDVQTVLKLVAREHRNRRADLRFRHRGSRSRYHDLLRNNPDLQSEIECGCAAYITRVTLLCGETRGFRSDHITAHWHRAKNVNAACIGGDGCCFAVLNERNAGIGNHSAQRIFDGSVKCRSVGCEGRSEKRQAERQREAGAIDGLHGESPSPRKRQQPARPVS